MKNMLPERMWSVHCGPSIFLFHHGLATVSAI